MVSFKCCFTADRMRAFLRKWNRARIAALTHQDQLARVRRWQKVWGGAHCWAAWRAASTAAESVLRAARPSVISDTRLPNASVLTLSLAEDACSTVRGLYNQSVFEKLQSSRRDGISHLKPDLIHMLALIVDTCKDNLHCALARVEPNTPRGRCE